MQIIKVKEVLSGGKIRRFTNSNKELGTYLKVIKLMKRLGVKV